MPAAAAAHLTERPPLMKMHFCSPFETTVDMASRHGKSGLRIDGTLSAKHGFQKKGAAALQHRMLPRRAALEARIRAVGCHRLADSDHVHGQASRSSAIARHVVL